MTWILKLFVKFCLWFHMFVLLDAFLKSTPLRQSRSNIRRIHENLSPIFRGRKRRNQNHQLALDNGNVLLTTPLFFGSEGRFRQAHVIGRHIRMVGRNQGRHIPGCEGDWLGQVQEQVSAPTPHQWTARWVQTFDSRGPVSSRLRYQICKEDTTQDSENEEERARKFVL